MDTLHVEKVISELETALNSSSSDEMKESISKTISYISNDMDTGKDRAGAVLKVGDGVLVLARSGDYVPIRDTNYYDPRTEVLGRITRINGSKITVKIPDRKRGHTLPYGNFYSKEQEYSSKELFKASEEQMKNSTFLLSVDKAKVA